MALFKREGDVAQFGIVGKEQIMLVYEVYNVVLAYFDVHIALFLLAEVEQLGDEFP